MPEDQMPELLERLSGESEPAWEARLHFLRAEGERSVSGSARALGKRRSLLTRWARRFNWRECARRWDSLQAQREEAVIQEEREASLLRQLPRLEQILELALARLSRVAHRDPVTGEITFDPAFTPAAATSAVRLTFGLLQQLQPEEAATEGEDADDVLRRRSTSELLRLLDALDPTLAQENQEANHANPPSS